MMLDRNSMSVIFSFIELKQRTRILLSLWQKTRNEVYPISTKNLVLSSEMFDFSSKETSKFIEETVISKLVMISEITFDKIDISTVEYLPRILSKTLADPKYNIEKVTFKNIMESATDKFDDISNTQELIGVLNCHTLSTLCLESSSDIMWYRILHNIDKANLVDVTLKKVTLTFMKKLIQILESSHSLDSLTFESWKLPKVLKFGEFQASLSSVFTKIRNLTVKGMSLRKLLGDVFIENLHVQSTSDIWI